MRILGIETTCDDTSVAVVEDGVKILACQVASQQKAHAAYKGVVPEVASRMHLELLLPTLHWVLQKSGTTLKQIDAVAVAATPGLMGSLLVGVHSAKALAYALKVPLILVNHLMAHLYTVAMARQLDANLGANFGASAAHKAAAKELYPQLILLASGGHTLVAKVLGPGKADVLASTSDDAAGECFDKIGKHLGLDFPGGPEIEKLAKQGNAFRYSFPTSPAKKNEPLRFTFSGLKTAVVHHAQKYEQLPVKEKKLAETQKPLKGNSHNLSQNYIAKANMAADMAADIAASFQQAAIKQLVDKTLLLAKRTGIGHIGLCGGVACNKLLSKMFRQELQTIFSAANMPLLTVPTKLLCSDNAAMIAGLAYHQLNTNSGFNTHLATSVPKPKAADGDDFFFFCPSSKKVRDVGPLV